MQAALDVAQGFELPFLWKRADRQYMMRSEKRPGYRPPSGRMNGNGNGNRRRRRPRRIGYAILTVILLILLWPVGLFPLWARKLRWRSLVKAAVTVATGAVFLMGFSYLLTMPTQNDFLLSAQNGFKNSMTAIAESVDRASNNSSQLAVNASRIASSAASLGQKALLSVVTPVNRNLEALKAQSGKLSYLVAQGAVTGLKKALYDTGLAPTPTPMPTPEPTPTPSPSPTPIPTPEPSPPVEMVWHVPGETVYHNDPTCGGLSGAEEITLTEALAQGLLPCEQCVLNAGQSPDPEGSLTPEATLAAFITQTMKPSASPAPTTAAKIADKSAEATGEPTASLDPAATVTALPSTPKTPQALLTPSPSPSLAPVETAAPDPTATATMISLPAPEPLGEMLVWHTSNGRFYHLDEHCPGMSGAKQYTLASSVEAGYKACTRCKPPAPELLKETESFFVWCGTDNIFHISSKCTAIKGTPTVMTFEEALLEEGYTGCAVCGADLYEESAKTPAVTPVPAEPAA